uniref:UDP-N-acetylglucosamine transferase subunit ALG14 n=1 Tax=Ditylenchus dipsaci TaxID=166011 RepID=A0A915CVN2_9BILA
MFLIQCESIHKIRKLEFGAEYRMARLTDLVLRSFKSRIERMESLYDYLAENNEKLLACNTQSSVDGARNMLEELFGNLVYVLLAINAVLFVCIIFSLVWSRWNPVLHRSKKSIHILAIIGSGGHTTEILKLLSGLGEQYSQRTYVLANSDQMGEQKVIEFEQKRPSGKFSIEKIPRSRELDFGLEDTARCCIVKWSWHCSSHLCISLPIWLPSNLHVKSLSLTALILYKLRLANCILVQWPELMEAYPRTKYIGSRWRIASEPECDCSAERFSSSVSSGIFKSPNFPQHYCNDLNCVYELEPKPNEAISLVVEIFATEASHDYVEVYQMVNWSPSSNVSAGFQLIKQHVLSGTSLIQSHFYSSVGGGLRLVFITDATENEYSGFQMSFQRFPSTSRRHVPCPSPVFHMAQKEVRTLQCSPPLLP